MTTVPTIPNVNVLILKQVQNDSSRYVLIYVDSSSKAAAAKQSSTLQASKRRLQECEVFRSVRNGVGMKKGRREQYSRGGNPHRVHVRTNQTKRLGARVWDPTP